MNRCARTIVASSAVLLAGALVSISGPGEAYAQDRLAPSGAAEASARDGWGLSEADWRRMDGPTARRALGFPANAPAVLRAAQDGDPKAMAVLAGAYATGSGVPRSPSQAYHWAKASADAGLPFGEFVLALQYRDGNGVPRDPQQYLRLMRSAADKGQATAMADLGYAYAEGNGVPKDTATAKRFLENAADAGVADAALSLGKLLITLNRASEAEKAFARARALGEVQAHDFELATQLNRSFSTNVTSLFVASYGDRLVGASVTVARPYTACHTKMLAHAGDASAEFVIDWTQSRPVPQHSGLSVEGLVGRLDTKTAAGRLNLARHADQEGSREVSEKVQNAILDGRLLNDVSVSIARNLPRN